MLRAADVAAALQPVQQLRGGGTGDPEVGRDVAGGHDPALVRHHDRESQGLHVGLAETHVALGRRAHALLRLPPAEHRVHDLHDLAELLVAQLRQVDEAAARVDDPRVVEPEQALRHPLVLRHVNTLAVRRSLRYVDYYPG